MDFEMRLQPCRIRGGWLVPSKDPGILLAWADATALIAPSGTLEALRVLRAASAGGYVGLVRTPSGASGSFLFQNPGRTGDIRRMGADFERRILKVWRVESVRWGGSVIEVPGPVGKRAPLV